MTQTRKLADADVFPIGLGAMPMSVRELGDERQAVATIRRAVELGVTLIDTADAYCPHGDRFGHNEELVARALREIGAEGVVVATKGGHTRPGTGWAIDGRPEHLRSACQAPLRRLGVGASTSISITGPTRRCRTTRRSTR